MHKTPDKISVIQAKSREPAAVSAHPNVMPWVIITTTLSAVAIIISILELVIMAVK